MRDYAGLPQLSGLLDCAAFLGSDGVPGIALPGWRTWTKPRNATMLYILVIGGGGGGGGGQTGAAGSNRGGGGGGCTGAVTRLLIPAFCVPDTLFAQPGFGGPGGAAGVNGTDGAISYITSIPNDLQFVLAQGNGGGRGNAGAAGVGGNTTSAGTLSGQTAVAVMGFLQSNNGASGTAGGNAGVNGSGLTWGGGGVVPLSGGTGGGGVDNTNANKTGGAISTIPNFGNANPVSGGPSTGSGTNDGMRGLAMGGGLVMGEAAIAEFYALNKSGSLYFTGGTGGGTAGAAGVGGVGGDGEIGCGGGGGGAGVTGGAGGRGGHGLVLIAAW
jgi:hypothetical protein